MQLGVILGVIQLEQRLCRNKLRSALTKWKEYFTMEIQLINCVSKRSWWSSLYPTHHITLASYFSWQMQYGVWDFCNSSKISCFHSFTSHLEGLRMHVYHFVYLTIINN